MLIRVHDPKHHSSLNISRVPVGSENTCVAQVSIRISWTRIQGFFFFMPLGCDTIRAREKRHRFEKSDSKLSYCSTYLYRSRAEMNENKETRMKIKKLKFEHSTKTGNGYILSKKNLPTNTCCLKMIREKMRPETCSQPKQIVFSWSKCMLKHISNSMLTKEKYQEGQ